MILKCDERKIRKKLSVKTENEKGLSGDELQGKELPGGGVHTL